MDSPPCEWNADRAVPPQRHASCGAPRESTRHALGVFVLMMVAVQLAFGPKLRLSQWQASAESNAAIAEGLAWLQGRLDITPPNAGDKDYGLAENRMHDTAYFDGRVYNAFPPLATLITLLLHPLHALLGVPPGFWLTTPMVLLVFWPLPIAGFLVFRRRVGNSVWAALLTLAWLGGTPVLPNLHGAATGYLGQMDHVLSQVGLLLLADNVLGGRRLWPGLVGLFISTWSRQLTFLYAPVLLVSAARRSGWKGLLGCAAGLGVIATPLLALNYGKFGNPLDFGYRYIYVGREDADMGKRVADHGVFSPHFIPENLYYMHLAPPDIDLANSSLVELKIRDANQFGTSLWITTPMALWIVIAARRWWREPAARWLVLGTIPVMAGLACYHSPGYISHGYSRFALDFLPVWLVVAAPFMFGGRRTSEPVPEGAGHLAAPSSSRRPDGVTTHACPAKSASCLEKFGWRTWLTLAFMAWGWIYFQAITPDGPAPRRDSGRTIMVLHGNF